MEEESLKLILWLVFIAVWIIAAFAKKKRETAEGGLAEKTGDEGAEGQEEGFPGEEYIEPQDELARFLRTIAGIEGKPASAKESSEKKTAPGVVKKKTPEPVRGAPLPVRAAPAKEVVFKEFSKPSREKSVSGMLYLEGLDREKLRRGVVLSEVLGPPRAVRPYRPRRV